jgi:hypothetical protein
MASIGVLYGDRIEEFEVMCNNVFEMIKNSKGLGKGSNAMVVRYLYDGSSC